MTTNRPPLLTKEQAATHEGDCVVQVANGWGGRRLWCPYRDGLRAWRVLSHNGRILELEHFTRNRRIDADAWLQTLDTTSFRPHVLVWGRDKEDAAERFKAGELI